MGRHHPKRFLERPVDARSRRVISSVREGAFYHITLECGHRQRRRFLCAPTSAICIDCPHPEGSVGIAGNLFHTKGSRP